MKLLIKPLRTATLAVMALVMLGASALALARPLYGFTPFPYDATEQAVVKVQDLLRDHATIYALHFDDGVPWQEILDRKPLPKKVQNEWDNLVRTAPKGRPVYLAITPLAKDRKSLAPGRGEKDYLPLPWSLKFASLDDDKVKAAYLEYARLAVRQFKPDYLNLGIEAGELASRDPKTWPKFESLYRHVATALKREYPKMQIGISFGLQSLRKPEVAARAKALVEESDYIGLSFYPHASPFGERFGDPALANGEDAWREPLEWVRAYTRKPIAFCETGYLTSSVTLKGYNLTLKGDIEMQKRYVRELAQFAEKDNYLFVVWFLAVDYDKLYQRMGGDTESNEVNLLWRNIGLWDGEVRAKPALEEWKRAIAGGVSGAPPKAGAVARAPGAAGAATTAAPAPAATSTATKAAPLAGIEVGFSSDRHLFQTGPGGRMTLDGGGALWSYEYQRSDWAWAVRDVGTTLPATTKRLKLRIKSDREGLIFLQLEEKGGETFFVMLEPGPDWTDVNINLADLKPDPAKRKDGVLQPDRLTKLLIADSAGRDKAKGRRNIWFERWAFE